MPTLPDAIAGRYRVLEEAGRGGMGAVYRCVDERLGREVAVKQVGRMPGESVTDQARALREARSSAALNHPNVVSVYDAIAEDDHIWLVMEYVRGRTLSQILRQDGPISPARAARIGAQVADGLAAAHERGTVHRDVKPGNVLVAEADLAKISDFGIARTAGDTSLTQTGILTGTPAYFAPEVARGGDPGTASDVWALGATLFAAVEGRPPFEHNSNALALLATIASQEPPSPERAGALTGPIDRMLDPDPAARWSMADVAHALHRVHEQLSSGGDETREDTKALAPSAPVGAAAAAGTNSETEADGAVRADGTADTAEEPVSHAGAEAPVPKPASAPVPPSARRRGKGVLLVVVLVTSLAGTIAALLLFGDDPGGPPTAGEPSSGASSPESRASEPSGSQNTTPQDTESAPEDPPETENTPAGGGAASRTAFVEDYYSVLPDDTETGWSLLSSSYRSTTSFGDYDAFWDTIAEVTVQDTAPFGRAAVDVTLLYDGSDEEVRRIYLERGEDSWLIADDEIVD